ncbi:MAG: dihydrolipoyl dehydrogenase [Desulfobacterales bacterium]|nr:dihydrolipoyl dehydrogenase [Desulfobacterales bacterium]
MKIIVVGAGPGGYTAGIRAAQKGHDVVVIEDRDLGGTCLNHGCIPSKIFRRSADIADDLKHMKGYGFEADEVPQFSMAALQNRKQRIVATQQKGIQALLKNNTVTLVRGRASLGPDRAVTVDMEEGGKEILEYDRLILATGSRPSALPFAPFDGDHILSSDHVLGMTQLPDTAVIVGGGVVGCEFAFILSSLGVKITVVEALDRMLCLPGISPATSRVVEVSMKKNKIRPLCNSLVKNISVAGGICRVAVGSVKQPDKHQVIEAQKVIVVAGRKPSTRGLNLEQAGIATQKGFVPVTPSMETRVENIYAIGDLAWAPGKQMLAHVAAREAEVAVDAICGRKTAMSYRAVPSAIFTSPEVACVGMTRDQALEEGRAASETRVMLRTLGKIQALGKLDGHAIVTFDQLTHEILGVELAGAHATDIIAEAGLAVEKRLTLEDICHTVHAHPTVAEIMMEVCEKAKGTPLHG